MSSPRKKTGRRSYGQSSSQTDRYSPKDSKSVADLSVTTSKISNTKMSKFETEKQMKANLQQEEKKQQELCANIIEHGESEFSTAAKASQKSSRVELKTSTNSTSTSQDPMTHVVCMWPEEKLVEQSVKSDVPTFTPTKEIIVPTKNNISSSVLVEENEPKQSPDTTNRFQMMDINITIVGLCGIHAKTIVDKKKKSKPNATLNKLKKINSLQKLNKLKNSLRSSSRSVANSNASPTSVTMVKDSSYTSDSNSSEASDSKVVDENDHAATGPSQSKQPQDLPIFALATFTRNTINSNTKISTHIPSLPLRNATKQVGDVSTYDAVWPLEHRNSNNGEERKEHNPNINNNNNRSSFTLSRLFQRENHKDLLAEEEKSDSSSLPSQNSQHIPNFIPEYVGIQVGLICGGQMIPLGDTTVIISGEANSIEMNLPLRLGENNSTKEKGGSKLFDKKRPTIEFFSKSLNGRNLQFLGKVKHSKSKSFVIDPSTQYQLDTNSSLRVLLDVIPHGKVFETFSSSSGDEGVSFMVDKTCIEVGTDNIANLWKTAPHDDYEVVEYNPPGPPSPPPPMEETLVAVSSKKGSVRKRNPTQGRRLPQKYYQDDSSMPFIPSPPHIKSTSKVKTDWNCLSSTTELFDGFVEKIDSCNNDNDYEEEHYNDSNTWGVQPSYDENSLGDQSPEIFQTPPRTQTHDDLTYGTGTFDENTYDDNTYGGNTYDENTFEGNTIDDETYSCDDSRTYSTYESKFVSLDSEDHSLLLGDGTVMTNGKGEKVHMEAVREAREILRLFAKRIGVDPEELI